MQKISNLHANLVAWSLSGAIWVTCLATVGLNG